jgi:hypothetical protein
MSRLSRLPGLYRRPRVPQRSCYGLELAWLMMRPAGSFQLSWTVTPLRRGVSVHDNANAWASALGPGGFP